jgi:hypothetical protein
MRVLSRRADAPVSRLAGIRMRIEPRGWSVVTMGLIQPTTDSATRRA